MSNATLAPFTEDSFRLNPDHPECDIVMKGGITSGVVYPLAVCELAQHYRLRSIGGASAGAIAAAVAAAAEYGRQTGAAGRAPLSPDALPAGFLGLAEFPELLSSQEHGQSLLLRLFRPQPQTRRLFEVVTGGLNEYTQLKAKNPTKLGIVKVVSRLLLRTARQMKLRALLGIVPGVVVIVLGLAGLVAALPVLGTAMSLVMIALGLALGVLGLAVALVTALLDDIQQLPGVGFGITSGRGETDRDVALTPWMHERIQQLARLPLDQPLTFGHLSEHQIELQVMTTNLSRLEPMAMPWTTYTYFYDVAEFRRLFGDDVVNAMTSAPEAPSDPAERQRWLAACAAAERRGLRPFPTADTLPIVVTLRMSLSFPVLIAAVRLYSVDETSAAAAPEFVVNWFSDGGLTSNLPVHFFDGPLPNRPTFAIDLSEFSREHPKSENEEQNSFLRTDDCQPERRVTDWTTKQGKPRSSFGQLLSFGVSLVETARTWVDEQALAMPGYRDRVVTVYQGDGEGGLNLSMPPAVVDGLSARGRFAARRLVDRFSPAGGGWPAHRWVRFRATTAALSDWFDAFESKFENRRVTPTFEELLDHQPPPYLIEDVSAVRERVDELIDVSQRWRGSGTALESNRPQVPPVLRLTPPNGPDRSAQPLGAPPNAVPPSNPPSDPSSNLAAQAAVAVGQP